MREQQLAFDRVRYPEPHLERTRELLRTHPEVRALFGPSPVTALFVVAIVAIQFAAAVGLGRVSPLYAVGTAWVFGAFANHALWTLIHECTHNLVFKSARLNAWLQILANGPIVFPAAISFRKYHLLHHRFQGHLELDADLASPAEAAWVGNSSFRKAFWLLTFFAWQAMRVPRLKRVQLFDRWYLANATFQVLFVGAAAWAGGWHAALYLTLSSIFAIGLHPVGARWIQEHYLTSEGQETFSYYGPLNRLAFNVGYHNEHHDVMTVAWHRLPKVRAMAPELYRPLAHHTSWTRLLIRFITDPSLSLFSRRVRERADSAEPQGVVGQRFTEGLCAQVMEEATSEREKAA